MAELQTVAAVLDLIKVAVAVGVFLNKVKNASKIAGEVCDRVSRLNAVLVGVEQVLSRRESLVEKPFVICDGRQDAFIVAEMWKALRACHEFLQEMEKEIGVFHDSNGSCKPTKALVDRFKIAWKHSRISHRQIDLEARISTLQTCLAVLQLFDQARIETVIDDNHKTLLHLLAHLDAQILKSNRSQRILLEKREELPSVVGGNVHLIDREDADQKAAYQSTDGMEAQHVKTPVDTWPLFDSLEKGVDNSRDEVDAAIKNLESCLRVAGEVWERFSEHTSNAMPDEQSLRYHDRVVSELDSLPSGIVTPTGDSRSSSRIDASTMDFGTSITGPAVDITGPSVEEHDDVWPCELLNEHLVGYLDRATAEKDAGHWIQAEWNLHRAIQTSDARERHYGIISTDRAKMQEELAFLYGKQSKWGEAVATVGQLIRGNGVSSDQEDHPIEDATLARQNELLGSIYFEWHISNIETAPENLTRHIETAERYVRRAFNKRFDMIKSGEVAVTPSLVMEHERCILLLISILEQRGMTVEANGLKKRLPVEYPSGGDSPRRTPTIVSGSGAADGETRRVDNPFQALIDAIDQREAANVQDLLDTQDINVNRISSQSGKTPLMHAVEQSNEPAVRRLLDPEVGGEVDFTTTKNASALHLAAAKGLHQMVNCLLEHDAEINAKDHRGDTPLTRAVEGGHATVIEVLSGKGADMMAKNTDEWSILHHAVYKPRPQIISLILDITPDLRDAVDRAGKTALHHCVEKENIVHARLLLEHPRTALDVNAGDEQERSPLYFAASKPCNARRNEMICLLLDHRAVFIGTKRPARWRHYPVLKTAMVPTSPGSDANGSPMERHDSDFFKEKESLNETYAYDTQDLGMSNTVLLVCSVRTGDS